MIVLLRYVDLRRASSSAAFDSAANNKACYHFHLAIILV